MKYLLISGPASINDASSIYRILDTAIRGLKVQGSVVDKELTIMTGTWAAGVDAIAQRYAAERGYEHQALFNLKKGLTPQTVMMIACVDGSPNSLPVIATQGAAARAGITNIVMDF